MGRKAYTLEERIIGVEVCERMEEVRAKAGLTQRQFARKIGVDPDTVVRWETKDKVPSLIPVISVAKNFGVSMDWLVFGKENENEKV